MGKFCSNCGKEVKEGADVCLNCGVMIKKDSNSFNNNTIDNIYNKNNITTNKIPGKGLSIAGMVLGIIAAIWSLLSLLSVGEIESTLSINYYFGTTEVIGFAIGYTLFSFIPSLIGLPLSIIGLNKHKSGINIAGLILNVIALAIAIIEIVYILTFI